MSPPVCLIPAAGAGLRARPTTELLPKAMLEVAGKPILQHTIELVRDQLGVESILVVTGYKGEIIRSFFGTGQRFNVTIQYEDNQELDKGLPWSIYAGRKTLKDPFLVLLGDEFYYNSNHAQLRTIDMSGIMAVCGLLKTESPEKICQNYSVQLSGDTITGLLEKPKNPKTPIMGVGTFLLSPDIFPLIGDHYQTSISPIDFISFLDTLCQTGHRILPCMLQGEYVNVNDIKSLELANQIAADM